MKILIFSHETPPMVGGAGTYVYELAMCLSQLGHDIYLLTGHSVKSNKEERIFDKKLADNNINITRIHWIDMTKTWFIYWHRIFNKYYKSKQPFDLVIFANYTSNVIGSKVFDKLNCPYRIVIHGDDIDYFFSRPRLKDYVMFNRRKMVTYFSNSEKIISVSNYLEKGLKSYLPLLTNSKVVHHGINPEIFNIESIDNLKLERDQFLKANGLLGNEKIILCSARLAAGKGQDSIIKALANLGNIAENAVLIFAGSGPEENSLKEYVSHLGVADKVKFVGSLARSELIKLYAYCDLFVMLSRRKGETFGIVFIEAMALGKPVIGTNIGGIPEVIEDGVNGFLVEPDDIESISSRIESLLNDRSLRLAMGGRGREMVDDHFNSKKMAIATIS